MRINNKSRHPSAYVEAHQRAYAWADKAIAYRSAGKLAQAKAATEKARYWLRKITLLQGRPAR